MSYLISCYLEHQLFSISNYFSHIFVSLGVICLILVLTGWRQNIAWVWYIHVDFCWTICFHYVSNIDFWLRKRCAVSSGPGMWQLASSVRSDGCVRIITTGTKREWVSGSWKKVLHSLKLTWHLKIHPWKRRFLLETIIFRFHVKFGEGIYI